MSLQRNRRADRLDRVVLTVAGVVSLGIGAAALAEGFGVFGRDQADQAVLRGSARDALDQRGALVGLVAILVLVAMAALALAWFVRLLRPAPTVDALPLDHLVPRVASDAPEGNGFVAGSVTLDPAALTDAVTRQLAALPGVVKAQVRIPDRQPVEIHALVDVTDDLDTAALTRGVLDDVRQPLRQATGLDDARFLLELRPVDGHRPRVA